MSIGLKISIKSFQFSFMPWPTPKLSDRRPQSFKPSSQFTRDIMGSLSKIGSGISMVFLRKLACIEIIPVFKAVFLIIWPLT